MRAIIVAGAGAFAAAIGAWTIMASRLFVWMGGLSAYFPSPWTTWWRYARHPVIDGRTLAYLIASGIIAAVPILLSGVLIGIAVRRALVIALPLYGNTGWATKPQMKAAGLHLRDRLP